MAPFNKNEASGSRKITSFFSAFVIPRERRPNPDVIDEEIVVASSRGSLQQSIRSQTSPQGNSSKSAQKRRRSEKDAITTNGSPSSSRSSSRKRGRGRPPQSASWSPSPREPQARHNNNIREKSTPIESPLRHNVDSVDGKRDFTPTPDSPAPTHSELPLKQPVITGGQISQLHLPRTHTPSPLTDRTKSIVSPLAAARRPDFQAVPAIPTVPTKSFSSFSTSTLSTALLSSASSTNALRSSTSSRRIVKDGLKAIANSDSDMSEDSAGEELAHPSSFFAKRRKMSPEPSAVPVLNGTRLSDSDRQKTFLQSISKSPPKKVYKHTLASLSRAGQRMREAEASIASMKQAVEESKKREEEAERQAALGMNLNMDQGAMLEWASDDEEDERRFKALQRVEALHATDSYHFFLDTEPLFGDSPFPIDSLPNELWSCLYAEDISREQACLSGFAAEMAVHSPLPMAITNWMARQLLHEQNEALCEAYVDILKASAVHHESISDTIASLSSIYKTRSIFENNWKEPVRRGLPAGLQYILRVVQFCAPASDSVVPEAAPSKSVEAFLDLAMMNLDDQVKRDVNLSLTLTTCIEDLLNSLPDDSFDRLISGVLSMLDETDKNLTPHLRCCLIASLPGRTARSYHVRRRLALDTFLPTYDRIKAKSSDWDWLESIQKSLKFRKEFDVRESTDHDILMSLIEVLDIAVSAGFTEHNELHPPQNVVQRKATGIFVKPPPLTQAARNHNSKIDAIVTELQYIKSRIQHESTHLRRQEVKASLERSIARLEMSVRTRPKPKKSVFGDEPKQARFDKCLLKVAQGIIDEPVTAGAAEEEKLAGPALLSIYDDLPNRPEIVDTECSPGLRENRNGRSLTHGPEKDMLRPNKGVGTAPDDGESSSDDFHTACEIS